MHICNFEGSRTIGKPSGWDDNLDGECLAIHVADAVDTLSGLPVMYTVFKPSDEELVALFNGGVLRLGIVGMRQHPVFNLAVLSAEVAASAKVVPDGDMGGNVIS